MGITKARDQAGSSFELAPSVGTYHRSVDAEISVILPHVVQDGGETSSQCNHRTLGSTTARKFCSQGSQPNPSFAIHHDRGGLTQGALNIAVASLGYPARNVSLARLVA